MNILLIVQPDRLDHYSYLSSNPELKFTLLWFEKASQSNIDFSSFPFPFERVVFWKDYRTPHNLLSTLNPDKVVFFEIIDLRQIALIVAAKAAGIPTFYLDHGAANDKTTAIQRWKEITFLRKKLPYLINRFRHSFLDIVSAKWFYYAQQRGFDTIKSQIKYNLLPFKIALKGPNETLANNLFRERVPKYSICFNLSNSESYQVYTGIERKDTVLTGIPFFDGFFRSQQVEQDYIVFIEHPNLEEQLLGWTLEFHSKVAHSLYFFAKERGIKIFVKLHPKSDKANWDRYNFDTSQLEVLQQGDFTRLYLNSKLILGYSSSLLTGFLCARKNVVLLGWHPTPGIFGLDFSQTGLCHQSLNIEDLRTQFDKWIGNNLTVNHDKYEQFINQSNYPFDGKATQRVLDAIRTL